MRLHARALVCSVVALVVALAVLASPAAAQQAIQGSRSADGVWQAATDSTLPAAQRRADLTGPYAVAQLDRGALDGLLGQAPNENAANRADVAVIMTLPLPDGRFSRFRIEESPIMEPGLAAKFPEIKTYRGVGLDDPTATVRFDLTLRGFHAQIIAAGGTVYVDPYAAGDLVNHVSYDKASLPARSPRPFDEVRGVEALQRTVNTFPITNGTSLRTYRLALAATGEYTAFFGGTVPLALSAMTTTMNRVNGIYEREIAVRLTMVANTNLLIYTNSSSDPYTNSDGGAMLGQNQTAVDTAIGSGNYDIGHVFSTGGGGVAYLQSVCNGSLKAGGVTGNTSPIGDSFDVDYVAHEMGHQFGGNHTFNSATGACSGGNRSAAHATEVGSGTTIMAYAGICGVEDTQRNSTDIFTFESLNEITAFITSGGGATCGTATATGNTVPAVSGPGASFTIPRQTPFALTATGSDVNGDAVTYIWEERDFGAASTSVATASTDDGTRPLFRMYAPTPSPTRYFPSLGYILNTANVPPQTFTGTSFAGVVCSFGTCLSGETLPNTNRTMVFHVTARDNRANGGGINTAQTSVVINASTGPFQVLSPNTAVTLAGGGATTVTWAVNSTNTLAANVAILYSTDGGLTFPTTLLASTANDGSEVVTMPGVATSTGRIKIQAVGNIFFDISDTNFAVTAGSPPGAFNKTAPASGATGVSQSPTLTWGTSSAATTYEYCIDTSANATCDATWVSAGALTSATLSGLSAGTVYSWQVRATNGSGTTLADTGTWFAFTTAALTTPLDDIVIDFGSTYGIWTYYDAAGTPTWSNTNPYTPSKMAVGDLDGSGRSDLVASFSGLGLFALMNGTTWVNLHPFDVSHLATGDLDGNGRDDIIATFAGYGVWIRYDSGSWVQLHPSMPDTLTVGNIDGSIGGRADVLLSFGSAGTWAWMNNTAFAQIHPFATQQLAIGDIDGNGVGDVVAQFAGYGLWIYYNNTSWVQLHPLQANGFVLGNVDGDGGRKAEVVINFPGYGVFVWTNNASWVQLHPLNPTVMATADLDGNGQTDLVMHFTGYGIFTYRNNTTWTNIHPFAPEGIVSGRINGN